MPTAGCSRLRTCVPKTSQGFTTEMLMSDGISYAPVSPHNWRDWFCYLRALNGLVPEDYEGWRTIADYLALLDRRTAQNVIAEIPYANVRVLAAGWKRGPLDDTQINIMRREVEQAMDAGAVGISTGLDYVAECFATTDELVEVCSAMAPWRGVYVTHVRYKKGTLRRRAGGRRDRPAGRRAGAHLASQGRLGRRSRRAARLRRSGGRERGRFLVRHLSVLQRLDDVQLPAALRGLGGRTAGRASRSCAIRRCASGSPRCWNASRCRPKRFASPGVPPKTTPAIKAGRSHELPPLAGKRRPKRCATW